MTIIKKGFTLIELLIVIAIIGILAALMLTNLQGARERARDARRKTDLDAISKSLRLYYNDNQEFPSAGTGNTISCSSGCSWGSAFTSTNGTVYMSYLPKDPSDTAGSPVYYKYYSPTPDSFALVATMENISDSSIAQSQSMCSGMAGVSIGANDYVVCVK